MPCGGLFEPYFAMHCCVLCSVLWQLLVYTMLQVILLWMRPSCTLLIA